MSLQYRSWIVVALLLAACGGEGNVTTDTEAADPPRTPTSEVREQFPGGGRAQVTLTGDQTAAPSYIPSCELTSDRGLLISMTPEQGDGPTVEVRVVDFFSSGKYRGTAMVRLPGGQGSPRESTGAVDLQLNSRPFAEEKRLRSGTLFSGSFRGGYTGEAGAGNLSGTFEGCFYEDLAPS